MPASAAPLGGNLQRKNTYPKKVVVSAAQHFRHATVRCHSRNKTARTQTCLSNGQCGRSAKFIQMVVVSERRGRATWRMAVQIDEPWHQHMMRQIQSFDGCGNEVGPAWQYGQPI